MIIFNAIEFCKEAVLFVKRLRNKKVKKNALKC